MQARHWRWSMAGGVAACCNWSCAASAKSMEDDAAATETATDQSATRGCVRRGRREEEMIADLKAAGLDWRVEFSEEDAKRYKKLERTNRIRTNNAERKKG